jgi:hypothetical protein
MESPGLLLVEDEVLVQEMLATGFRRHRVRDRCRQRWQSGISRTGRRRGEVQSGC